MGSDGRDRNSARRTNELSRTSDQGLRVLSYDETKAAEAAFQGWPFNPEWSDAARKVYDGLVLAMGERQLAGLGTKLLDRECVS